MFGTKLRRTVVALSCLFTIAGCGGGNGSGPGQGTISVSLMDRPIDGVTELHVTITAVRIKPRGNGPAIDLPMESSPMTVDLLSLTDQNAAVLVDNAVIDAGGYNWLDIDVDDSDISKAWAMTMAGGQVPVQIDVPSDQIRLVSGFEVGPSQALRFLFDWEVNNGLTEAVGRNLYILKPAFRVLRVDELGAVSGRVTNNTAMNDANCKDAPDPMVGKVVYFFDGEVTPDDTDGMDAEPVTTVDVEYDPVSGDYLYRTVLDPGDYTVALTCFGDLDTELASEDLMFIEPLDGPLITVAADAPNENVDF
jgi:hypothetical protein